MPGDEEGDDDATPRFLLERLESLGLDPETYAPYVVPLLTNDEDDSEANHAEEWDSVVELLRASSETCGDDDAVWDAFRNEMKEAWCRHRDEVQQKERERVQRAEETLKAELEREKELAERAAAQAPAEQATNEGHHANSANNEDEKARNALVARFAYEPEDGDDVDDDDDGQPVLTNRQVAAQAAQEKVHEMRSKKVATKKEEQQKTAQSRREKEQKKEERRNRATKGERKR